jgi:hypothetical protein
MNRQLLAATSTTETAAKETQTTTTVPVEEVLAEIARDSRRDAAQYLDESVTPFGGE